MDLTMKCSTRSLVSYRSTTALIQLYVARKLTTQLCVRRTTKLLLVKEGYSPEEKQLDSHDHHRSISLFYRHELDMANCIYNTTTLEPRPIIQREHTTFNGDVTYRTVRQDY